MAGGEWGHKAFISAEKCLVGCISYICMSVEVIQKNRHIEEIVSVYRYNLRGGERDPLGMNVL